jgi:hypothetical protein
MKWIIGVVAMCAVACDGRPPTAPSPAAPSVPSAPTSPSAPTISGTVWLHAADGVKPFSNASVFGWIESATDGRTTGRILADTNGRYVLPAAVGTRVRIMAGGSAYQPCAVTVTVTGDVTRDVHTVDDRLQLGAHLPSELLTDTPTLSGLVFEIDQGNRRPLAGVRVELDGLFGLGVVTATTLTDADGRYVLCGLGGDTSTYVFASKAGYGLFEMSVGVSGNSTLDIELRR